jgi:hypothetical protein
MIDNFMHKHLIDAANEANWNEESMLLTATRFLTVLADQDEKLEQRFKDYLRKQFDAEASEAERMEFVIPAEAHSDDRVFEVPFDAEEWFKQASDDEILQLAQCDWGGNYPADSVAEFMAERCPRLAKLFEYLEHIATLPTKKDVCGFECSIDDEAVMRCLRRHEPELAKKIEAEDQQDGEQDGQTGAAADEARPAARGNEGSSPTPTDGSVETTAKRMVEFQRIWLDGTWDTEFYEVPDGTETEHLTDEEATRLVYDQLDEEHKALFQGGKFYWLPDEES